MGDDVSLCRYVKLACNGWQPPPSPGVVIERGTRVAGCHVLHTSPSPCILAPSTDVRIVDEEKVEIERRGGNVLVYSGGELYVYPERVWSKLERRLFRRLERGGRLPQQGAILYGPPGTGKTSMAYIIAKMYGLEVIELSPENVLRKYMGESEAEMAELLNQAEHLEPSMVLLDDAEWVVSARSAGMAADSAGRSYLALLQMLFDRLQRWNREARRIIGIVTTNMSEAAVDQALRRGGRLGKPIYVPLPDVDAVKTILEYYGVDVKVAEEYAVKIVNAGLSMADAVNIAQQLTEGEEPDIEPVRGAGYIRAVPPSLPPQALRSLRQVAEAAGVPSLDGYETNPLRRDVIHIALHEPVAVAFAVAFTAYALKRPVVIASDPRRVDEAAEAADAAGAYLLVASESMAEEAVLLAYRHARLLILAGRTRPQGVYAYTLDYPLLRRVDFNIAEVLVLVTASFYGIPLTRDDKQRLLAREDEHLLNTLAVLSNHPVREKALARVGYP